MTDPLSGYAAINLTQAQLYALYQAGVQGTAALQAELAAVAAAHGVGGAAAPVAEVIRSIHTATTVAGQTGSWASAVASAVPAVGETAAIDVVAGELAAAAAAAAPAAPAATGFAAWWASAGAATQAAVIASAFVAAALGGYVIGNVAGWASADNPIEQVEGVEGRTQDQIDEDNRQEAEEAVDEREAARSGYVVVRVTNHPRQALSVRRVEDIAAHDSGSSIFVCQFLHGGNCASQCVTTPNGNSVCGADVPADLSVVSTHTFDDSDDPLVAAWRSLCAQVPDVVPATLAEGFVGTDGTTIDWANTIFPARPCDFDALG
jgi:hypothetical protein